MFNFNYDPQRQGYDQGVWKTVTGYPSISGSNLLLNSASIIQQADCLRGTYNFKLIFNANPAAAYLTGGSSATSDPATWGAVSNGEFSITINGTSYNVTGINFSGVTTMNQVAEKIQAAIRLKTCGLESVTWSTNHFIITGKTQVSVTSAVSGGTGTDISGVGGTTFMDSESGVGVATSGDDKRIGLLSLSKDVKVLFLVYGDELRCVIKDENGITNTAIIPWVAAWTSSALMTIKWYGTGVSFYVNGDQVATFNENVPATSMSPYIYNTDGDNLLVSYVEGVNVDTYAKTILKMQLDGDIEIGAIEVKDGASDQRATVSLVGTSGLLNVLSKDDWDYCSATYNTTSDVWVFKVGGSGGTTVRTITINYVDSTKDNISNIVVS